MFADFAGSMSANESRSGAKSESRGMDETPPPFFSGHAVQIVNSKPTEQPIAKQCAPITTRSLYSRSSSTYGACNSDDIIVTWCPGSTPSAQAVRALNTPFFPDRRRGWLSERR